MNSKKHKLILDANIYISAVLFGGKLCPEIIKIITTWQVNRREE